MRSRWGYVFGVVLILAGSVVGITQLMPGIFALVDGLQQVRAPGETQLQLAPGSYTIFHEYQTSFEGTVYSNTNATGLEVSVAAPDGTAVPVETTGGSNYSVNGRMGTSVWQFTIADAGTYHLSAVYPAGQQGDAVILAVGSNFVGDLVFLILRTVALFFAGGILGVAMIVVTLIRRRRARRMALTPRTA